VGRGDGEGRIIGSTARRRRCAVRPAIYQWMYKEYKFGKIELRSGASSRQRVRASIASCDRPKWFLSDGIVEDAILDTGRQLVAAHGVPVFGAIDRLRLRDLHRAHVGRGRIPLHIFPIVENRDAEIGGPPGSLGWLL
jgi:hypothetical protein